MAISRLAHKYTACHFRFGSGPACCYAARGMAQTRPSPTMQMPATLFEVRGLYKAFDAKVPLIAGANLTV